MPRFNVHNPDTDEWRCFSSVIDGWITDWMEEERYLLWREHQYGEKNVPLEKANQMSLEDAEERILLAEILLAEKWDEACDG